MRRTVITIVVIVLIALLLALLFLFLQTTPTLGAHMLVVSSSPTVTSTSTASTQSTSGIDPAVVAALIGLAGVVVADDIHRALWNVSRRVGVRVFMMDGAEGKKIEVVRWERLVDDKEVYR